MFDFGNANDGQRQAISTTEGPVLITAGPGTGKTYTLVQRAIYLIEERGVKPEDIFIATFTEKAAKELITRITNELASRNITVNVNEMYVGTFHSLCLRIIKDHLEYTRLKKNYRLLDTFDQQYLVFRNIYKFRTISGIENVMPKGGAWKWAQAICEFSNNLTEEVVDIDAMLSDHDMEISVIAKVVNTYQAMLDEENLMDFSAIQTECYRLLKENKDILEDLRNSIKYIMVDEYQDTNYIQEQTIFLLGTHENICVVGDDDQGLYRFRGATIRNILEFPSKFDVGKCQIIPLVINYRSDSDIVEFYNKWMITTSGSKFKFEWDKFRYDKRIVANETSKIESPCVVKLASKDDEDEWHERVLDFINRLKNSGKIQDYNQLAFLFSSVKHERVISLARFLESNHINVYSPRSDMFFRREEVMQALGCMMLMFPNYVTPGVRKYYAVNKFERLYKPELLDTLFVILNLWKVVNKGEELEDEAWSKNIKIRQTLDILTSYPNEYWKYPVVIYYVCYRNEENFETRFARFLNKLLMELMTKYLMIPTINAVKPDILKLNSAIVASDIPTFEFKTVDMTQLEPYIQNPNRNAVRMLLKTLAYEHQDDLLPAKWEIEHIFPQKWQTNYFPDEPDATIKEKIEHIGNKLPFEKKLNIVAGNGYFGKKKKEYTASEIVITKAMGTSDVMDWNLESITKRDIRVSDEVVKIMNRWNNEYLNISISEGKMGEPSEEELAQIEKFKKNGWI